LVTSDEDHRVPHAHRLVRRLGNNDKDDPHDIEVSSHNDFTAEYVRFLFHIISMVTALFYYFVKNYINMRFCFRFNSMGIIHTAKRNVKDEIVRKLRVETLEDRRRSNIKATLSIRDEAEVYLSASFIVTKIDLH